MTTNEITTHEVAVVRDDKPTRTALWDSVCETNPAFTKEFNRGGGFRGTGIGGAYLALRATEAFGPCGIGWGMEILEERYVPGAPFVSKDGAEGQDIIHVIRAKLWYLLDGKRGEVVQFGQTTFVGTNKYGVFTDEEAPKKSLTDAMTKCLSLLGFAADVHMGQFDDPGYVDELRKKFGPPAAITADQAIVLRDLLTSTDTEEARFLAYLQGKGVRCETLDDLPAAAYQSALTALRRKQEAA